LSLIYKLGFLLGRKLSNSQQPQPSSYQILSSNVRDAEMSIEEPQDKAKRLMIERSWDSLLIDAYLTTKHFVAWSIREDFEAELNIGVSNIKGLKRNIDISYVNNETEFLTGTVKNINFQLGGVYHYSSGIDGDAFNTANISLFIDDVRVLAVRYLMHGYEAYSSNEFSILSVEEFHQHPLIDSLLQSIHAGKVEQEQKQRLQAKTKENLKYAGKFTF
jgi:hypothetical protein